MATSLAYETSSEVRPAANYNSFFHPNLCHVCKVPTYNLLECSACHMIYYCSNYHMTLHETEHAEICIAIVILRLVRGERTIDFHAKTPMEWVKFKNQNIKDIRTVLERDLKPYEKQMFLFPKSCFICYTQENLLPPCKTCLYVNTCNKHGSRRINHNCIFLRQSYELDFEHMWPDEERKKRIFEKSVKCNIRACPDIKTFIRENIENGSICTSRYLCEAFIYLSEDLSGPLSLIYAMNRAGIYRISSNKSYVIHILIETPMDKRNVYAWELLLHQFCRIQSLSIEAIGRGLLTKKYTLHYNRNCKSDQRKIHYRSHNMTYCEYANARKLYKLPNVIVVFNVDLTCNNDIRALQYHCCPLLMLAQTRKRADNNIIQIYQVLSNMETSPVFPDLYIYELNKFPSLRPCRDYMTGSAMFPSRYLIYYKDLEGKESNSSNSSNSSYG
ncbi:uncharacterized protein LOC116846872 [Odontomachus brunneus]|uniref:uncharacterized protein LOC116846870 n=1 Tax=Odontomachus brunneus TaxID=486640 RepID=UPI0013F1AFEA|nr:uncharacterized protein LOC116846870 [Odontomachus brunneus]XP_032677144.1 uncharacterized protein LOC116846871 [Odontomachus brunneus]XP_032677145.1 uncharacterized protein LOC116846872 [Odontomachus brunneus]